MKFEHLESSQGLLAKCSQLEAPLNKASDFLDVLANAGAPTLVLSKEDFAPEFFDLKTGLAGEILQKVSNYRKRLVIIGDFEKLEKKSLKDFIYESNRTGQVIFESSLDKALSYLK